MNCTQVGKLSDLERSLAEGMVGVNWCESDCFADLINKVCVVLFALWSCDIFWDWLKLTVVEGNDCFWRIGRECGETGTEGNDWVETLFNNLLLLLLL